MIKGAFVFAVGAASGLAVGVAWGLTLGVKVTGAIKTIAESESVQKRVWQEAAEAKTDVDTVILDGEAL